MSLGRRKADDDAAPAAKRVQRPPPAGPLTPLTMPASMRPRFAVAPAAIEQPILRMQPRAAIARAFPDTFADMARTRSAELAANTPRHATRIQAVQHFPRFSGNASAVAALGEAHLGGLGGGFQGGMYPSGAGMTRDSLPSHIDLSRHRPSQMLSQLSEVMMHGARNAGLAHEPVEIQFGYGMNAHGELDVFASANNPDTQNWLEAAMAAPAGTHLLAAATAAGPAPLPADASAAQRAATVAAAAETAELHNIGAKLLFHDEQQQRRGAAVLGAPDEDQVHHDLALASAIRAKFLSRDITIVKNPSGMSGRHAEQNIGVALHQGGYPFADIQGTKIRCHSCRAELGSNLTDEHGMHVSGKVYGSQASTAHLAASFQHIQSGHEQIATPLPARPRADSFASLPAVAVAAAASAAPSAATSAASGAGTPKSGEH
ncbi:MAG: hypothetical protein H6981_02910 [Gammaproteobacteria bacterium]|nr:hypothetical protein [Gammaproteobacteria bacterium]MCP5135739.1 hypothetical protein [Gammaproteobacteria bacterium]